MPEIPSYISQIGRETGRGENLARPMEIGGIVADAQAKFGHTASAAFANVAGELRAEEKKKIQDEEKALDLNSMVTGVDNTKKALEIYSGELKQTSGRDAIGTRQKMREFGDKYVAEVIANTPIKDPVRKAAYKDSLLSAVETYTKEIGTHEESGYRQVEDMTWQRLSNGAVERVKKGEDPIKVVGSLEPLFKEAVPWQKEKDMKDKLALLQSHLYVIAAEADKTNRINAAATNIQEMFNLNGPNGRFNEAYAALDEPKVRENLNINFQEAQAIRGELRQNELQLRADAVKQEKDMDEKVTEQYFKMYNGLKGTNKDAETYLDKMRKERKVTEETAYKIRDKVQTDLQQRIQWGRSAQQYKWSLEAHSDWKASIDGENIIRRGVKPELGNEAVDLYRQTIVDGNITGKDNIKAEASKISNDPKYTARNQKKGFALNPDGTMNFGGGTSDQPSTAKKVPPGTAVIDPNTGDMKKWTGTRWDTYIPPKTGAK